MNWTRNTITNNPCLQTLNFIPDNMPIRPFRKTKRILTREEQISMHERAKASAERDHQEKERLIAEGKLRREFIKVNAKTTIVRYIPVDDTTSQ